MKPRRAVLTPELDDWCAHADEAERTTAVVRLAPGSDPDRATSRLEAIGMEVASSGPGSVIGNVSPGALRRIGRERWVVAVEQPHRLRPLGG
ncbi:MAG TPA: hypothetical protein VD813_10790 [Pseudonocardia sp.]|nr:hypothetical protein [Pseudonocardia sp.]